MDGYVVTPLHAACMAGNRAAVDVLLEHGARVRELDPFRRTPLHLASRGAHVECIERLLQVSGWAGQSDAIVVAASYTA
jgi:ankyrin repeat protein